MEKREEFLKTIETNIREHGHHITTVIEAPYPRFTYSIGAFQKIGFEVVFAGGLFYTNDEIIKIINTVIGKFKEKSNWEKLQFKVDSLGIFSLSKVEDSWSRLLLLGAHDFHKKEIVPALQILPDENHHTLEIPKLYNKFNPLKEPIWQWLENDWTYPVSKNVTVVTNLNVLHGESITEVMRWEKDEWEMFAGSGPDVPKEEVRIVPLGVIIGIDKSILPSLDLQIGKGFWRDETNMEWNDWG